MTSSLALELFISAFTTLFVVIDPPGCAPVFGTLTTGTSFGHRRKMAGKSILVASMVLLLFGFFGRPFLAAMHISLDAFRIAGGLMLFLIAIDMVFEKRTERRETRAEKVAHDSPHLEAEDISVFPMGIPMIAGPGAIAAIMLLMSQGEGHLLGIGAVLAAAGAVLLLTYLSFLTVGPLLSFLGSTVVGAITRIFGVILAALAAQYVVDGVRGALLAG